MASVNHPLFRQDSVVMTNMPPQVLETEVIMANGPVPQPVPDNGVVDEDQMMKNPALPVVSTGGDPFKI
jgi:hypothetical protein